MHRRTLLCFLLAAAALWAQAGVRGNAGAEESFFIAPEDAAEILEEANASEDGDFILFSFAEGSAPGDAPAAPPENVETPASADAPLPLLVNEDHLLPESYEPDDLVMMREYCDEAIVYIKGSQIQGRREAVDALLAMLQAAIDDGVENWQISSGYRSVSYQQKMWDDRVYKYRKEGKSGAQARAATARYMARPGASEHHTGLAFDVTVPGEESFVSTRQCDWLHANCWDYGFIIRFTEEKKDITGINAEPWHIRYVGLPHSRLMQASGECLEEYLGKAP